MEEVLKVDVGQVCFRSVFYVQLSVNDGRMHKIAGASNGVDGSNRWS